jgi:hypothetical protein
MMQAMAIRQTVRRAAAHLLLGLAFLALGSRHGAGAAEAETAPAPASPALAKPASGSEVRIGQLVGGQAMGRNYAEALPSLLRHVREETTLNVVPEPVVLSSFEDERLLELSFVYANFADRADWTFTEAERSNLKGYLERGGFLFIDAGITAAFLRENAHFGQHHSFGEWEARPEVKEAFAPVFPGKEFTPLKRSHGLYRAFYEGLPDTTILPDTVRRYVEQEKWPDGTYSAVALQLNGRIAVLVTPIIAMGWGRNSLGAWSTIIRFRVLEETEGLGEALQTAAYSGERFEVTREDGDRDVVYCQRQALPAWANEPGGRWRVFRYYGNREISDFAHVFYTRLGTNILVYAMTH